MGSVISDIRCGEITNPQKPNVRTATEPSLLTKYGHTVVIQHVMTTVDCAVAASRFISSDIDQNLIEGDNTELITMIYESRKKKSMCLHLPKA